VIATGARPSVDLSGPLRVDAWGVQRQVASCQRVGVRRVVLVSSLCAGRWAHPLNLFGLILVWKRLGEQALERSGILSPQQREIVIERLLALDASELDVDQLKWVVLMVLSSQPGEELACARMEDLVFDLPPERPH